jgi:hypothetical protein
MVHTVIYTDFIDAIVLFLLVHLNSVWSSTPFSKDSKHMMVGLYLYGMINISLYSSLRLQLAIFNGPLQTCYLGMNFNF